jgi:hypothetical protein
MTWKAKDACGNESAPVSQTIMVVDNTPPSISAAGADATIDCPRVPSFAPPTASDTCDPNPTVLLVSDVTTPGACAGTYSQTMTWKAKDACGNESAPVSQTITVQDVTDPVIVSCPEDMVFGECSIIPDFSIGVTDNCSGQAPTVVFDPPQGTPFPLGPTTVNVTVTDACGNSAQCSFLVTIVASPQCAITGPETICAGASAELCGPDGEYDYLWSNGSTMQCITVGVAGTYSLTITDANGCSAQCSHELFVQDLPVCTITGPSQTCSMVDVELCGPDGNYMYSWTGPGGFASDMRCISVANGGSYELVIIDLETKCASLACTHVLTNVPCFTNCPRTIGFWGAQCDPSNSGVEKFTTTQMNQITACVDDKVGIFSWPSGTDFNKFCQVVNTSKTDQRTQAKRQFAAFLANLCADEQNQVADNGDQVILDPTTPFSCDGLTSTTIGGLVAEIDGLLLSLEGQSLRNSSVKQKYSQIIACLGRINNGVIPNSSCPDNLSGSSSMQTSREAEYLRADVSSVGEEEAAIESGVESGIELFRPTPNPFANSTHIAYAVSGNGEYVEIGIYDIAGRRIRSLVREFQSAGRYDLSWNGQSDDGVIVRGGVYFLRSSVGGVQRTLRLIYVQ